MLGVWEGSGPTAPVEAEGVPPPGDRATYIVLRGAAQAAALAFNALPPVGAHGSCHVHGELQAGWVSCKQKPSGTISKRMPREEAPSGGSLHMPRAHWLLVLHLLHGQADPHVLEQNHLSSSPDPPTQHTWVENLLARWERLRACPHFTGPFLPLAARPSCLGGPSPSFLHAPPPHLNAHNLHRK